MTFRKFLQLIHKGVFSAFYLVSVDEDYCINCKSRDDLISKLHELNMLDFSVVGIHPYSGERLIIEFKKGAAS